MDSLSIVIPTHNRAGLLERTLTSLLQVRSPTRLDVEVIVVPNACSDDTLQVLQRVQPGFQFPLRWIETPQASLNLARNAGVEASDGEFLALLDDDVLVDPSWMYGLLEALEQTSADLLGGRVHLFFPESSSPEWMSPAVSTLLSHRDYGEHTLPIQRPGQIAGANFGFWRRLFDALQGFSPLLDRMGTSALSGGDTDFVHRALRHGYRAFYAPRMKVRHIIRPDRLTIRHLSNIAHGRGQTTVALARLSGSSRPLRLFAPAFKRLFLGAAMQLGHRIRNNSTAELEALLLRKRAQGMLVALLSHQSTFDPK